MSVLATNSLALMQPEEIDDELAASATKTSINLDTIRLGEFIELELPKRDFVLSPILPVKGLAMLYAARGVGKTHVGLGVSYAVASGSDFLRWNAPQPRPVLYVDGEMPQEALQERLKAIVASSSCSTPAPGYFRLLSMDRQALGTSINLANPDHQTAIEAHFDGIEFIVLDNLSTLANGGRENDAESWNEMQRWLLQLRRRGITVLVIHHAGRSENARGTSKREDVLDTIIQLRRPADYKVNEGARFEVHLTKARGNFGDDAQPYEARLVSENGIDHWVCNTLQDRTLDQVEKLTGDGMSVRDIGEELELSKSKVNRIQAKLRDAGRL